MEQTVSEIPTFVGEGGSEPPAETTDDPRDTGSELLGGDGGYNQDQAGGEPITDALARIVTRGGGRIPVGFEAFVQNEGYARSRDWTVYAPASNPYHIAAEVMDYLNDHDAPDAVDVRVEIDTAEHTANVLRDTNLQWALNSNDPDANERIEEVIEWLRYSSAYSDFTQAIGEEAMPEIVARLKKGFETADISFDEDGDQDQIYAISSRNPDELRTNFFDLTGWAHDAWDHCLITVSIHESADNASYV